MHTEHYHPPPTLTPQWVVVGGGEVVGGEGTDRQSPFGRVSSSSVRAVFVRKDYYKDKVIRMCH